MRKLICLLALAMVVVMMAGCAAKPVYKDWMAVGGSRSDATIKLGYTYNSAKEIPTLNQQQALDLATQKCQTWGYERAEPFGSVMENCGQSVYDPWTGPACIKMNATAEFQCVGKIPPEIENVSAKKVKK